ncbi:MAG: FimV/HubP family polar landmark protein, partial [Gammaproteobacteria bacterium]
MRKLIVALALGAILIPNNGSALGLGEIEVSSALNQKLTARIDLLSAAPEDAESLLIRLASREEFARAGLDRPIALASLKFKTSVEDGRVFIEIFSPKPIREPFLNFLVEVDWPKGHLIREYTILLDPPTFMGGRKHADAVSNRAAIQEPVSRAPVIVQPSVDDGFRPTADSFRPTEEDFRPTSQSSGSIEPVVTTPVAREEIKAEPIQQQERYTAPTPSYTAPAPSYAPPAGHRIQKGDTAWSIANRTKPDSVSTQQMLIAMLRTNPDVFIDGNVNGLKKGFILRAPDMATINAVNHEEAIAAVRQQNALWREYQQSLSTDKPASAIAEDITETESSSAVGSVNDKSRLSIVSAGSGSSVSGEMDASVKAANKLREQLALAREQVETERVEKETLQQQVDSLSTQVEKMKGLLVIEDKAMAEIQSAGDLPAGDLPEEKALVADDVSEEMAVEDAVAEPSKTIEQQALDALDALAGLFKDEPAAEEVLEIEPAAEEVLEIDPAAEEALKLEESADQLFFEETGVTAEQAADAEMLTEQEMLNEMELANTTQQEASLIETLLNNKMVLGGLLVVLLVIGAIVYLLKRRRRNASGASSELKENEETGLEDDFDLLDDAFMDDLVSDADIEAAKAESEAEG